MGQAVSSISVARRRLASSTISTSSSVVGASGGIGSAVATELEARGWRVTGLSRSGDGLDVTVLVGDLFIPPVAAEAFSTALLDWTAANDVAEVTVLSGVPIPHGPDGHRVFYVASEDYQERRLSSTELPPMTEGFLDGVNASLMQCGLETDLATGILTTPVHSQGPDVEAALRLIEGVRSIYGLDIDTEPLEAFAAEVRNYYEGLSQHLDAAESQDRPDIMFG